MYSGLSFEDQLADAEKALQDCIKTHGEFHELVSYKLDAVARLLRSKGIRLQDATNMEARAKSIRKEINTGQMKAASRASKDIMEAMSITSQRRAAQKKAKAKSNFVWLAIVAVIALYGVKVACSPSSTEKQVLEGLIGKMNPATMLQNNLAKGEALIKDTQDKTKEHADEVDALLEDGTQPEDTTAESSGN